MAVAGPVRRGRSDAVSLDYIRIRCDWLGCRAMLCLAGYAVEPGIFSDHGWRRLDGGFVEGLHLCPEHANRTTGEWAKEKRRQDELAEAADRGMP